MIVLGFILLLPGVCAILFIRTGLRDALEGVGLLIAVGEWR